jgi:lycopene cyclase domain-containing protein
MPYFLLAQLAIVAVVLAEIFIFKTGLFSDIRFWLAYGIVVFFQLLTNGYLTFNEIVTYNPEVIGGTRVAFAPVEDLFFGFSLVTMTMLVWVKIKPSRGE